MRITKFARVFVGIASFFVTGVYLSDSGIVFPVKPSWRLPRCSECGRICPGYDHSHEPVRWVHLGIGAMRFILEYAPRRVQCPDCGVRVELVPWARPGSRFTRPLEEMTAYLAQITNKTEVSRMMGISWRTVGNIVKRVVADKLDPKRLDELRNIGVDELSFRKRHKYITTVVDHDTKRIVWAAEGKSAETLDAFFDELGEERTALLESITIDMSAAFIKSIKAKAPKAQIVFDRFHVQKLASDAVDKVRREMVRNLKELDDPEEAAAIKKSRYALLKNPWDLSAKEWDKLAAIQKHNAPLYRAYLLKESLAAVFDETSQDQAGKELDRWLAWASRSKLGPFVTTAQTIREHKDGILAYIKTRLTNGLVEGFNNKLRMIARRAFGFHSADALIGMLFLCCGGVMIEPPLPGPWCNW
ncbi:MAG: ISL3 family transposase [Myxococcota bacterium]|nr:ISL3 family transposase [Myxococcota bacterium]